MTHQAPPFSAAPGSDPGHRVAQLRELLRLVGRIAGESGRDESGLDAAARISAGWDRAAPIAQRRFDALLEESAGWAAAGVEALLAAGEKPPRAAAARLGSEIRRTLGELEALVA